MEDRTAIARFDFHLESLLTRLRRFLSASLAATQASVSLDLPHYSSP